MINRKYNAAQIKTISFSSRTQQTTEEEYVLNSKQSAPVFGKSSQGNVAFSSDIPLLKYVLLTEHKTSWISQCGKYSLEQAWLDLCCDKKEAKAVMIAFLKYYIRTSIKENPVLGPEEVVTVQTIGSTRYILEVWKNLVMEADNTVLGDMRQKHPEDLSSPYVRCKLRLAARRALRRRQMLACFLSSKQ